MEQSDGYSHVLMSYRYHHPVAMFLQLASFLLEQATISHAALAGYEDFTSLSRFFLLKPHQVLVKTG
jgi:hypothetical protein